MLLLSFEGKISLVYLFNHLTMILIVMYLVMIIHDLTFPIVDLFIQSHIYITLNVFGHSQKAMKPIYKLL
jgi:hypothetical protein